jgi:hypothetical protein
LLILKRNKYYLKEIKDRKNIIIIIIRRRRRMLCNYDNNNNIEIDYY